MAGFRKGEAHLAELGFRRASPARAHWWLSPVVSGDDEGVDDVQQDEGSSTT
jgi:hypothetical protein